MKGKRQSTVEPVFGTLAQFMGIRKINTKGLEQANKVMHLSAIAYNLKKYLKFKQQKVKSVAGAIKGARTIADLEHTLEVNGSHIGEAIQYRSLDREGWLG